MTTTDQPITRTRTLIIEGDGRPTVRTARQHAATADIAIGEDHRGDTDPALRLAVNADGSWSLLALPHGRWYDGYTVAAGTLNDITGKWRITHHVRDDGNGCPWALSGVVRPGERAEPGDHRCPDRCAASGVEPAPADPFDTDADSAALAWACEGELCTGTVHDLAQALRTADASDSERPTTVYAVSGSNLVPVSWGVTRTRPAADGFAAAEVRVTLPDGTAAVGYFSVDCNA